MADAMSYLHEVIGEELADDDSPVALDIANRVLTRCSADGRLAEVLASCSLRWLSQDVRWRMAADRKRAFQQRRLPDELAGEALDEFNERAKGFLETCWEIPDGPHMRLRSMTAADLGRSAATYESRSNSNLARAMFLRAVADKIGDSTVGEMLTEEQLEDLAEKYLSEPAPPEESDTEDAAPPADDAPS